MRKTFRMFYGVVVCMSLLIMTSCNKTGAVKEAAEKAASSCPLKMSVLGDITGISFADDAVVLDIAVDSAFKSNEKVNDFISKYLALELTKSTPELAAAMSEAGIGLKANIKPAGSDAVTAVALEGDGVKALSAQMTPERQMSEVLLSLYNADIAQGGVDLGNGFRVASVAANKGIEDFTVNVDESKVDFKALQDSIGTLLSKKDVGGLLCMVNDFAGIVVPAISEMNYDLQVRYETPAGKRTFFKIDNADIKSFLNPVKEEEK